MNEPRLTMAEASTVFWVAEKLASLQDAGVITKCRHLTIKALQHWLPPIHEPTRQEVADLLLSEKLCKQEDLNYVIELLFPRY